MVEAGVAIELDGVRVAYAAREAVAGVTLRVESGEWLGILGPNGAGKTTLLRVLGGYLRTAGGRVALLGRPLAAYPAAQRARVLAAAGSEPPGEFAFTVAEYVLLGRTPHAGSWWLDAPADWEEVYRALDLTGTVPLAGRRLDELSSGERQRVHLARALAQRPRVLLLDEPTAHLDLQHQVEVMQLLERLRAREGLTVVAALHDLNLAALYCRRLVLMDGGRVYAAGEPAEVLREDHLRAVYRCPVRVVAHPEAGVPQVLLPPPAASDPGA